jgi:hypothetical protein
MLHSLHQIILSFIYSHVTARWFSLKLQTGYIHVARLCSLAGQQTALQYISALWALKCTYVWNQTCPSPCFFKILFYNGRFFVFIVYTAKFKRSRNSAVCIVTGCWLDNQGVGVKFLVGSRIFSSPQRPDRIWGPPSFLSKVYRKLFLWVKAAEASS